MVVKISKKELERALLIASPFLDKKNSDSVMSNYLLKAIGNKLIIKATDITSGISVEITNDILIKGEGEITADGKKFLSIVKSFNNDKEITLETSQDVLIVKQGRSRFKIKTINETFRDFPTKENKSFFVLDSEILHSAFKKILPAIDIGNPKYELHGGLISIEEDKVNFVATDTKRLIILEESIDIKEVDNLQLILHKHSLIEISKLFFGQITIFYDEDFIIIESDDIFFFSKLIGGTYPNYKRIVPQELKYHFTLPKAIMQDIIKMLLNVSDEVKFTVKENMVEIESIETNSQNTEAKTEFEINSGLSSEEVLVFGLNIKYLNDFLHFNESETFVMSLKDVNRPILIQNENHQTIIMPVTLG